MDKMTDKMEIPSDVEIPQEMVPQLEALKNVLMEIQDKKVDDGEVAAMCKNYVELNTEGKKPRASVVKSQLALYKKELMNTQLEMERVKKALGIIMEIRGACLSGIASANKEEGTKESVAETLKEAAETLPLWIGDDEDEVPPLCGAIQIDDDYVANTSDLVAAFVTVKGKKLQEWILAEVRGYNEEKDEYKVVDIDDKLNSNYTVRRDQVIPLPVMRAHPEENPNAIFSAGTTVLALYENTTCFYKALVHEAPSDPAEPYKIAFEDTDCAGGYSPPTTIPQRYVLAYKDFSTE